MTRKDFGRLGGALRIPSLLDVQLESFFSFLQLDVPPGERKVIGLEAIFRETFPVEDVHKKFILEYVSYSFGPARYAPDEAVEKGTTYAVPLKATLRLVRRTGPEGDEKIRDVIEEEIYLCELPFMTTQGSFIINGVERVVVSQLHRAPGVYFSQEGLEYSALLVPARGAWFELVLDKNNVLWAVFDRRKRIAATTFLRALGIPPEKFLAELFTVRKTAPAPGQIVAETLTAEDGTVYARPGDVVNEGLLDFLKTKGIATLRIVESGDPTLDFIVNTLHVDKTHDEEDALRRIYYRLRAIAPHSIETARSTINGMLYDRRRFDLARVGRYKLNARLGTKAGLGETGLQPADLIALIKLTLQFGARAFPPDDIDHLANRRVRRVGELLENQFRIALLQLAQTVRERAAFIEESEATPQELINARLVSNTVMKFFTSNQLSQFLDQTNPLAELTHKRRVSALGPGGLTKDTAGFEVRDIHYSHYGRICPIETPEGPNIGLISTISTYAKFDEFGFVTTPYRRVKDSVVTRKIEYLNATEEDQYLIAQANAELAEDGRFATAEVLCRRRGDFVSVPAAQVDYMDVSPKQILAPSAVLVPFLEHDDADRALMGANMQRQAVPLLKPERPIVATGSEGQFALESGAMVTARADGTVAKVDARQIVVKSADGFDEYRLKKFIKSNQYTCIHQRPVVQVGDPVKKGGLLADGPATDCGELALGCNVFIAYMPMRGHNYEDAIVISESLLGEDKFTSVQILEFELQARETKLGPEEITRDIPGASEDELRDLDEFGVVRVGAEVGPGDLLVGRITPKGEIEFTPEERLLWAIFGEKATNVKDTSLRVEAGVAGVVMERRILSRRTSDPLAKALERQRTQEIEDAAELERKLIIERRNVRLADLLRGTKAAAAGKDRKGKILIKKGEPFGDEVLAGGLLDKLREIEKVAAESVRADVGAILNEAAAATAALDERRQAQVEKVQRGDELPHGVLKSVKIFIAQKRRLAVGDKMSGRHGNKGVVAKILPREEMPFLPDGRPVDMVLNPLGVPSRMNIGQILETTLGWAGAVLGFQASCPVFEGATPEEIKTELRAANLPEDGKTVLCDGRTGLPFEERVVVGILYMMKLIHMVDDKIHARSTGRYSLITQQPLGGKAQFGGQRFGEMEVWALEAYGAAYALQEMLTIKSDDVEGRSALYESLIRGKNPPQPRTPASFNVLVKEIQGLCLELVPEKEKR